MEFIRFTAHPIMNDRWEPLEGDGSYTFKPTIIQMVRLIFSPIWVRMKIEDGWYFGLKIKKDRGLYRVTYIRKW